MARFGENSNCSTNEKPDFSNFYYIATAYTNLVVAIILNSGGQKNLKKIFGSENIQTFELHERFFYYFSIFHSSLLKNKSAKYLPIV